MDSALITDTLGQLLNCLAIPFGKISTKEEGNLVRVDIECSQASRLIGWHGETLNSLQHVLKSMLRTKMGTEKSPFIVLDVDGYRLMQEDKVRKIAEAKADFVRRTGNRVTLSPMSPYFRRVVHMHIANTPSLSDITTESMGEGDYRHVVIRLKEERAGSGNEELSPIMPKENDGLENLDI
ncbi:MAG: KH domain-containing protein [Candidatus Peribacteraceae bacterium]|nr:KH domain-containing protein [Candidatus Peribacteraceae bacterium]